MPTEPRQPDASTPPPAARLPDPPTATRPFQRLDGVISTETYEGEHGPEVWRARLPEAQQIVIPSSADGTVQPAMWLPPSGQGLQPLLVVLHSWSAGYDQRYGIPFGQWGLRNGWGMIHPHYRGEFGTEDGTASDLAVQDVLDAINFAVAQGGIQPRLVFVTGYSGGAMMSLVLAGRHPERFAGVAAWVPIHDLTFWYRYNESIGSHYADDIVEACGGEPSMSDVARATCTRRSPAAWLDEVRRARVPVYIGHGLGDVLVPPVHAVAAFNQLASPHDRIDGELAAEIGENELPEPLPPLDAAHFFGAEDPPVLFARHSGPSTLVLFDGGHAMVINPTLSWMTNLVTQRVTG